MKETIGRKKAEWPQVKRRRGEEEEQWNRMFSLHSKCFVYLNLSNLKIKKIGVLRDTTREPKPTMVQCNTVQYRKI